MMQYISLIFYKVLFSLRAEVRQSYLNYFWWILEPILHMAVFFVVFDVFLKSGTENFVAFLLTGLVPWLWFARSVSNSMNSVMYGKGLMTQVDLPKAFFPTVVVMQDCVKESIVLFLLLLFLTLYGIEPTQQWLWILVVGCVHFLLVYGVSLIAALSVPFFPDFRFLISTGLQLLMFASGIFYDYTIIAEENRDIFFLNPLAVTLKGYRDVLIESTQPDWEQLGYVLALSVILIALSFFLAKRFHYLYPRLVSR